MKALSLFKEIIQQIKLMLEQEPDALDKIDEVWKEVVLSRQNLPTAEIIQRVIDLTAELDLAIDENLLKDKF